MSQIDIHREWLGCALDEGFSEFLVVEDTFEFTGRGLVLAPNFDIPSTGWMGNSVSELVIVVTPVGEEKRIEAIFSTVHLNFGDQYVPVSQRWRIEVLLRNVKKDEIPIGSRVFGPPHIVTRLLDGAKRI